MDLAETYKDTEILKTYESRLKKIYPDRCLALLVAKADQVAEEGNKRSDYRKLAGLLHWMQKYPGGDLESEHLALKYREAYPRRRAMLEEIAGF